MTPATRSNKGTIILGFGLVNLDSSAAQRLRREVLPMIQAGEGIVLDMDGVEFADTSVLGSLCALMKASSGGRTVALAHCTRRLETIFAQIPEGRLPPRYPTIAEAAEAVAQCSRPTGGSSTKASPPIVAFPIHQPVSSIDDRWTIEGSHVHGHVD